MKRSDFLYLTKNYPFFKCFYSLFIFILRLPNFHSMANNWEQQQMDDRRARRHHFARLLGTGPWWICCRQRFVIFAAFNNIDKKRKLESWILFLAKIFFDRKNPELQFCFIGSRIRIQDFRNSRFFTLFFEKNLTMEN